MTKLTERVLYFGKVDHECNPRGILKILYAHKWIHIFSILGILKCNFRGWWRKKAAPRWSGTSKKGSWLIVNLGEQKRNGGGGWVSNGWKKNKVDRKWNTYQQLNKCPPPLNKTLFFSAVTQYYSLKGINCDTKYYFFNKTLWVNTCRENLWTPESDFKALKVLEIGF